MLKTETLWQFKEKANEADEKSLSHAINVSPFIAQLLLQRGITDFQTAKDFFCPNLSQWRDPFLMKDMDKAVERIKMAQLNAEKILVFGDYDADGVFSTAIVFDYLQNLGIDIKYYLPDRLLEGYGLSFEAVHFAKAENRTLMLILDNGTTAHEKIDFANSLGIDTLIIDHHLPEKDKDLPNAFALVNPQRADCPYPFKDFCSGGLALKLIDALSGRQTEKIIEQYAVWATIATAADIVSMTDENRLITFYGLEKMNRDAGIGLEALIKVCEIRKPLVVKNIVMQLVPKINAAGRVAKADAAFSLLFEKNNEKALQIARELIILNVKRKHHTEMVLDDVLAQAKNFLHFEHGLVLYGHAWHIGVVGMSAYRCCELFCRPTVVLCDDKDGILIGSVRSHDNINVIDVLNECSSLLIKFGGHRYAAGISLAKENLEKFREKFNQACKNRFSTEKPTKIIKIDVPIKFEDLTSKALQVIRRFAPFGPNNMRPVFEAKKVRLRIRPTTIVKDQHLLLQLEQNGILIEGTGFFMADRIKEIGKANYLDICFVVSGDEGEEGKRRLKLEIRDFKVLEE